MANPIYSDQVLLAIPMPPDMELVAAKLTSAITESMRFNVDKIEEIQLAVIESCLNAFEHSKDPDQLVSIEYTMRANELEFKLLTKEATQRGKYNFQ